MCTYNIKTRTHFYLFFFIEEAYFCWCARSMQVIFYFSMTQSFTFLFLWQTLTSSTSTDTEFSSFSEFCNGFSDTLNNKSKLLKDQGILFVHAGKSILFFFLFFNLMLAYQFYGRIQ